MYNIFANEVVSTETTNQLNDYYLIQLSDLFIKIYLVM